ncbi:MoaD/ThiS family protein [Subtercola boreus]|uniref:MoaD/ThiS family protein n=1 Tax=Subtercola boreus TaxID=120213 RepID=UPI001C0F275B|nr:MoaD/ThiS family protein [Subtercola boreus]
MQVRVRYFAAAKAAAGVAEDVHDLPGGSTIEGLLVAAGLGGHPVIGRSSFLVNGVTVPGPAPTRVLVDGDTLDVLPPFAGG